MLEPEEVISRFHVEITKKYPQLTLEELNLICRAPFIFLRRQMAKVYLPRIRFKYWGVFMVKKGRLEAIPKMTKEAMSSAKGLTPNKIKKIQAIMTNKNLNSNNDEK